ncbi:MAG: hypothetical protein H6741_03870 [Alphaproteobacteria bacterium]|nr:hypothetical protein [Alphaproteobacteria bacterium]MCB9791843.1 hypothetical protein [Alphaproteobacteria bacterium]
MQEPGRQQRYARALLKLDRPEDAKAALEAVPVEQRDATGALVAGVLAVQSGDMEGALEAFEGGLMRAPMPELAVNRCVALRELGRPALEPCREAIRLAPDDPRAFLALAEEGLAQQAPAIAEEALQAAQPLLERDPAPWAWAAALNAQLGRWEAACALGVGAGVDTLELAQACAAAGQEGEARRIAESLSSDAAIVLLLRLSTDEAERTPPGPGRAKAVERARRWARQLPPPHEVGVLNDLGRLDALDGEEARAEARWREAMALAPEETAPRLNLAEALWARGAEEAALELVEGGAGLDSMEALALGLRRARWWAQRGQRDEAIEWLRAAQARCQAWGHAGCEAEVGFELALREAEAGRGEAALAALTAAADAGGAQVLARAARESAFEPLRGEVDELRMDREADAAQGSGLVSGERRQ